MSFGTASEEKEETVHEGQESLEAAGDDDDDDVEELTRARHFGEIEAQRPFAEIDPELLLQLPQSLADGVREGREGDGGRGGKMKKGRGGEGREWNGRERRLTREDHVTSSCLRSETPNSRHPSSGEH